jgi:hypothetical protein
MQKLEIKRISLAEAVMFAQQDCAVAEAQRHLELNQKLGNRRQIANWRSVLAEIDQKNQQAYAA